MSNFMETNTFNLYSGSGSTIFATFEVLSVGAPYNVTSTGTFTGTTTGIGRFLLETGEGIVTTERFLAITGDLETNASPPVPATIRDQSSGILYSTTPNVPIVPFSSCEVVGS